MVVKKKWSNLSGLPAKDVATQPVTVQLYRREIPVPNTATPATDVDDTKIPDPQPIDGTEESLPAPGPDVTEKSLTYDYKLWPTSENGQAVTYFAKETKGADPSLGYTTTYDYQYTDETDDSGNKITKQTITVSNAQHGFDITKLAANAKSPTQLGGAKYDVIRSSDDGKTWSEANEPVSSKDDKTVVPIVPGIYLIQETTAPSGFKKDPKVYAIKLSLENGETADNGWMRPTSSATPHFSWETTDVTGSTLDDAKKNIGASTDWQTMEPSTDTGENPIGFSKPQGKINLVHFTQKDELKPLQVIKVDASDELKTLPDATFTIGVVGATSPVSYKTNKDGQIVDGSGNPASVPMAPGEVYQIEETNPPEGYEQSKTPVYLKNGVLTDKDGKELDQPSQDSSPADLVQGNDNDPLVLKFKDRKSNWSLNLVKQSTTDANDCLSGAKFELTAVDGDGNATAANITTGDDGTATQTDLKQGQLYKLTETHAPAGYQELKDPIYVKDGVLVDDKGNKLTSERKNVSIGNDNNAGSASISYTLTVKDEPERILPHTGGLGPRDYLVFALCMLGIAICLLLLVKLKRQEVNDHD